MSGKVYLVGAGPGDVSLLTLKAKSLLEKADVIIYDRLVSDEVLKLIPKGKEMIYVGKEFEHPSISQQEINEILVREAKMGKTVVRLKQGDPSLFGRMWEEVEALQKSGIPYEIVPGVTSALAAPAYAGIPITHRKYASSVAIVTGHEDPSKPEAKVNWEKLATAVDTIIILMGVKKMKEIAKRLIVGGRSSDTKVAVIERGTMPNQRVIIGRLDDIAEKCERENVRPPAVIVVGDTVRFYEKCHLDQE